MIIGSTEYNGVSSFPGTELLSAKFDMKGTAFLRLITIDQRMTALETSQFNPLCNSINY